MSFLSLYEPNLARGVLALSNLFCTHALGANYCRAVCSPRTSTRPSSSLTPWRRELCKSIPHLHVDPTTSHSRYTDDTIAHWIMPHQILPAKISCATGFKEIFNLTSFFSSFNNVFQHARHSDPLSSLQHADMLCCPGFGLCCRASATVALAPRVFPTAFL